MREREASLLHPYKTPTHTHTHLAEEEQGQLFYAYSLRAVDLHSIFQGKLYKAAQATRKSVIQNEVAFKVHGALCLRRQSREICRNFGGNMALQHETQILAALVPLSQIWSIEAWAWMSPWPQKLELAVQISMSSQTFIWSQVTAKTTDLAIGLTFVRSQTSTQAPAEAGPRTQTWPLRAA